MSDPCDKGCRADSKLSGAGTFTYSCAKIPDPIFFGLQNYNLTIENDGTRQYKVSVNGLSPPALIAVASFRTSLGFIEPETAQSLNANFEVSVDDVAVNNRTLVISTKNTGGFAAGVTWRLGSNAIEFSSCLLIFPDFLSCVSSQRFPLNANGEIVFSCPILNSAPASKYNLNSYNLTLIYLGNNNYSLSLQFSNPSVTQVVGLFSYTPEAGFTNARVIDPSMFSFSPPPPGQNIVTVLSLNMGTSGPIWKIRGDKNFFYAIVLVPSSSLGGILLPQPPSLTPNCPTLFGELFLTADQKQICQTNFRLTFYSGFCADCPQGRTKVTYDSQERNYVFYSTNVASVVNAPGCTLLEKAEALTIDNRVVTTEGLATYGMLRLMLSFILFGHFDLNLLRKQYYKSFLKRLSDSGFCAYRPLFVNSPYWQYFCP